MPPFPAKEKVGRPVRVEGKTVGEIKGKVSTVASELDKIKGKVSAVASKRETSELDKVRKEILANLGKLGALTVGDDDLIYEGSRFILPATMEGNLSGAIDFLRDQQEQQKEQFSFSRTFKYRPADGASAFELAMKRLFGTVGVGKTIYSFFGNTPPTYITVNVSPTETRQVPWGRVQFMPLSCDFYLQSMADRTNGPVFHLTAVCPRRYRRQVEAFFAVVEEELRANSIYRGKAFTGAEEPVFIDTDAIDPNRVVYSEDVMTQLTVNMWSLLRYTANMQANGIPLKRAVLVEGPYGTGKTLAGMLTAKEAVENGWTYIQARPEKDDLAEVLRTAQLYAPAVVWYEDIDTVAHGDNYESISGLLDALDGVTNKGVPVLAGFTTNHVEKIHKGVLRPGRLDAVIHIGSPTPDLYELLVKVTVPEDILGDIDWVAVGAAFAGYVPAFATEAINRAMRYRMSRNGGIPDRIETEDLVNAANGLRPQLELQQSAREGAKVPTIDAAFERMVSERVSQIVDSTAIQDHDGDRVFKLAVNGNDDE